MALEGADAAAFAAAAARGRVRPGEGAVAEAGKVWERGRNWTTVVVEIVPGAGGGEGGEVLKVPVFVYVEEEGGEGQRGSLAFWTVVEVGRVGAMGL